MSGSRELYIIAGGGTGGHIYPALAIAEAVKKSAPNVDVHFVGTLKGLETTLVPKAGYPLHFLPVSGVKGLGLVKKIFAVLQIPVALVQAVGLILKLKPRAVLGVGGYASGPMVLAAALLGKKTALFEPNAYPGLTNTILAKFVEKCFVTSEAASAFFSPHKIVNSGMPLRKGIEFKTRSPHQELRVLVTGGSQGARAVNDVVSSAVELGGDWMNGVRLVHQTGATDFEKVKLKYAKASKDFEVHPFLHDMPERMAWADIVVSRAGAGTIAELAAAGKASVLVPFPFAADNHQQKNAEALEKNGACVMILQHDFDVDRFKAFIQDFKMNRGRIEELEKRIRGFHKPDSAQTITQFLRGL